MPLSSPKVAIIIVNWNGWQDTIECLGSLEKVTYPNFSVYVVDNGSTDESIEKLDAYQLSAISYKLIKNGQNLGFAGGNNVGIKKALEDGADYLLLLNNDTLVSPDFLAELVQTAESEARIGIVGPKIYFTEEQIANNRKQERKIWFGGGKLNWLKTKGHHANYGVSDADVSSNSKFQILDSEYITGCCLLIKRTVIERIGLLSEDYFLYYEDVDWCLKAKKAGFRVVYVPGAHIWHKVSRSAKPGSSSYVYYHVRNCLMLSWRHGNTLTKLVLPFFIAWTFGKQLIKLCIPGKRMWAQAVLKGMGDFLAGKSGKL